VQEITVELMGPSAADLDESVIKNAAEAVLHYFKQEVGTHLVSIGEFSRALERVLRGLGFEVHGDSMDPPEHPSSIAKDNQPAPSQSPSQADLQRLAADAGESFELMFFPRLRQELRRQIRSSPRLIRFVGLRECVKLLVRCKRWSPRCRTLEDQIVEYLRTCLRAEPSSGACGLVVR
jgi:hypothetical protein